MAGLSRNGESIFFDPFNGGRVLQRHELERMAEERGFEPSDEMFEPADPVAMVSRSSSTIDRTDGKCTVSTNRPEHYYVDAIGAG